MINLLAIVTIMHTRGIVKRKRHLRSSFVHISIFLPENGDLRLCLSSTFCYSIFHGFSLDYPLLFYLIQFNISGSVSKVQFFVKQETRISHKELETRIPVPVPVFLNPSMLSLNLRPKHKDANIFEKP